MRLLVTGAAGFIGSNFVRYWREAHPNDGVVALDLLTDSLALVGQHGVYCRSERFPGQPKMDIALILEQLDDAKQLVQSAMEEIRSRQA